MQCEPLLNEQQRVAYDAILKASRGQLDDTRPANRPNQQRPSNVFFLDGLGGAGKTFTYNCLLNAVRADGKVAVAVASSGIAALLLEGGRTAHSRFCIPVQALSADSTCYISRSDPPAELIRAAALIIWDEAPMMHRHVFEAVDRTLRDIMTTVDPRLGRKPFGGKVVVMGGDFRQILPVVPRSGKADIVAASLNQSHIWSHVRVYKLHVNMRVQRLLAAGGRDAEANAAHQQAFADWLQGLGEGTETAVPDTEDYIRIPPAMCCRGNTLDAIIREVYGELRTFASAATRAQYITERAILTPLNAEADAINKAIVDMFDLTVPGGAQARRRSYLSADSVVEDEQRGVFPTEFLNTLEFSGVPPHALHLQEGCPIILLRNMTTGLANGTRLIVIKLMDSHIEAEVVTGPAKGQRTFIPRLAITPSDTESLPFTLCRRQFPVRPAFAMTINKSQGQTFKRVGLYLPKPVFSHGQLYVGASRVGCPEGLTVMVPDCVRDPDGALHTRNVVYKEVLLQ